MVGGNVPSGTPVVAAVSAGELARPAPSTSTPQTQQGSSWSRGKCSNQAGWQSQASPGPLPSSSLSFILEVQSWERTPAFLGDLGVGDIQETGKQGKYLVC